jgi:hypothetical protein
VYKYSKTGYLIKSYSFFAVGFGDAFTAIKCLPGGYYLCDMATGFLVPGPHHVHLLRPLGNTLKSCKLCISRTAYTHGITHDGRRIILSEGIPGIGGWFYLYDYDNHVIKSFSHGKTSPVKIDFDGQYIWMLDPPNLIQYRLTGEIMKTYSCSDRGLCLDKGLLYAHNYVLRNAFLYIYDKRGKRVKTVTLQNWPLRTKAEDLSTDGKYMYFCK